MLRLTNYTYTLIIACLLLGGAMLSGGMEAFGDSPVYTVGGRGPAGGIIIYDKGSDEGGWRYLEAAPADLVVDGRNTFQFGGFGTTTGASGSAIGTGMVNTQAIIRGLGAAWARRTYAARMSTLYTLNGFSDWFLPSKDELILVFQNSSILEGITGSAYYWSSTENGSGNAWRIQFPGGTQVSVGKGAPGRVRPIRAFSR